VVVPLVLLSIRWRSASTVTAFLFNGLAAARAGMRRSSRRSSWRPRSARAAILLIVLQVLRRFTKFEIQDGAIWKIAELMAYAMFLNLFLHGAEAFKEFYSGTEHLMYTRYWFLGLGNHRTLVPFAWTAVGLNTLAFLLFIVPARKNWITLNIGCLAIYAGCYIDKGMGLIIPGLTPDVLGEIYEYYPTLTELRVAAGVFALGFLVFTLMLKVAVPISLGQFQMNGAIGHGGQRAAPVPASR
jgi:molybdopterin-containing oxidoreductase family membrane subunit